MKNFSIRLLYLYLFAFVGLLVAVIGTIRLVELGMKVYIFKDADQFSYYATRPVTELDKESLSEEEQKRIEEEDKKRNEEENRRQRQREVSGAVSMIVVGVPLYLYHWKTIQKENKG